MSRTAATEATRRIRSRSVFSASSRRRLRGQSVPSCCGRAFLSLQPVAELLFQFRQQIYRRRVGELIKAKQCGVRRELRLKSRANCCWREIEMAARSSNSSKHRSRSSSVKPHSQIGRSNSFRGAARFPAAENRRHAGSGCIWRVACWVLRRRRRIGFLSTPLRNRYSSNHPNRVRRARNLAALRLISDSRTNPPAKHWKDF